MPSRNVSQMDPEIGKLRSEIREREEHLRDLLDGSVQGVAIRDGDTRLFLNEACAKMFGFGSAEELLALGDTYSMFAPHMRKTMRERHLAAMEEGSEPQSFELECRRKDGSPFWVSLVLKGITWQGLRVSQVTFTDITGLKEAEEKVVQNDRWYRELIEGLPLGICIQLGGLKPVFANDACAKIFGYARGSNITALGSLKLLVAPKEHARLERYRTARLQGDDAPFQYDFQGIRKDGTVITCSTMAQVILWNGDRAIQHSVVDISERERVAQKLRESEERYRVLIEDLPVGVCVHKNGKPLLVNDAHARIYGYAEGGDIVKLGSLKPLVAPEEWPRLYGYRAARLAGKEAPSQYDYKGVRKDGTLITCHTMVRVIEWEGGRAIQHSVVDITERERAAQKLQASERRYRDLIEGSMQGISIRGPRKRLYANKAFAQMYGFDSVEELLALPVRFSRIAIRDRARARNLYESMLRRKRPPEVFEFEGVRKDGSSIWVSVASQRIEWEGEPAVQNTHTDITAKKQAEEKLRASERRFRDLIEGSVQGINIRGSRKRLYANKAFAQMFGYDSVGEILALQELASLAAPHKRALAREVYESMLRRKQPPRIFESEGLRKDGSSIFVSVAAQRIEWEGEPAVQTTYTDVTERKQAEEELRSSEERYRELFEGSVQGIMIKTDRPVLVNEAMVKIFGYDSAQEIMNLKEHQLVAPHERGRLAGYRVARLRGDSAPSHYEIEGVKKDGSRIWLSKAARMIRWNDELAIQNTFTDITEKKQAEEELRSSEERYRELFEGSVQGIMIKTDRRVLVNEAMVKIFGYDSVQEIMKLKEFRHVPPHERERLDRYRAARLGGDMAPSHFELEGLKKDGSRIWLSVAVRVIRWNDELAIQSTYTDITETKRTEAELLDAKMESIGAMARGIASEFNSIYGSILGTISMAKMEAYASGESRIVEILSEAERTSTGVKKLIQDLMLLNRAGVPVKEKVTVEELLREILPLTGGAGKVVPIRGGKTRINLSLAGNLWAVDADRVQVNQALGILVGNGFQAEPNGGVLAISAENVELKRPTRALNLEAGRYVKITIRGQGERIPADLLKNIFDPYFPPVKDGPGMTLASAFSIARQHGGTIKVLSDQRRGNRFQVFLPAYVENPAPRRRIRRNPERQGFKSLR